MAAARPTATVASCPCGLIVRLALSTRHTRPADQGLMGKAWLQLRGTDSSSGTLSHHRHFDFMKHGRQLLTHENAVLRPSD